MAGEIAYFAIIVVIGSSNRNRRARRTKWETASKTGTDHVDHKPVTSSQAYIPSIHLSVRPSIRSFVRPFVSQSASCCETRFRKKRVPRGSTRPVCRYILGISPGLSAPRRCRCCRRRRRRRHRRRRPPWMNSTYTTVLFLRDRRLNSPSAARREAYRAP